MSGIELDFILQLLSLKFLGVLVTWRGLFLFLLPNWGRVAGRSESDLGGTVPLPLGTQMCVRRVFFQLPTRWQTDRIWIELG